jgi:hypothetical protein
LAQFGPAAFIFASDKIGVPLTQLRISSLDRGFLSWFPSVVEISWAPSVVEADVLVASAAYGEIA